MTTPTVSVIIPTYNRVDLLPETLDSVLAQTYKDYEIIVVDHGSTDGTSQALTPRYGDRVRWVELPYCELPACPRNAGIQTSRGSLIAFLDSDDLWLPHKLERQVEAAAKNPNAALFFSQAETFDGQVTKGPVVPVRPVPPKRAFEHLLFTNCVPMLTTMVRREVFDTVGVFNSQPEFRAVEDYDLWLRIAHRYPVHFTPEVMARCRLHRGGLSRRDTMAKMDCWELVLKNLFKTVNVSPALKKRALAHLDIERFKFMLRSPETASQARVHLQNALSKDPWNLPARALQAFTSCGGTDLLRFSLLRWHKQVSL
jgi:glycosyltransferase involved in cell wall biosynthesis